MMDYFCLVRWLCLFVIFFFLSECVYTHTHTTFFIISKKRDSVPYDKNDQVGITL